MNMKPYALLFLLVVIVTVLSFALFYVQESIFYLLVGLFVLLAGVVSIVMLMTFDLYKKDKEIDYEMVEKLNLHLVVCKACEKENILEDQYCRFCGDLLEGEQNV